MVLNAVYIVLCIFLLIGVGLVLAKVKWLNPATTPLLPVLVTRVALPGMIISNIFRKYTRASLLSSAYGALAALMSLLVTMGAGLLIARLVKPGEKRRGVFVCMFTFSNSVFIGLPVSIALFGDEVVPYTLLYYIANTVLFWSAGHYLMSADGGGKGNLNWKKLLPPPLLVFVGAVALVLLGVQLPPFVLSAADYIGGLVTPLSLFYTGALIYNMLVTRSFRWRASYAWVLVGRFAVAPLLLLATSKLFQMPELMRNALLIQAAMPVMSQTPIVAGSCLADDEYAAGGVAVTTASSLLFIPLYMALIPYL